MFDIDPARLRGLKVATVGLLVGASGFGVAFLGAKRIGLPIMWIGWLTVCAGLVWHLFLVIRHFANKK